MNDENGCRYLRTKRLYIPEFATDAFARRDPLEPANLCWCNKTMMQIGVDEHQVSVKSCSDPGRACYRKS